MSFSEALDLAARGWPCFPAMLTEDGKKVPIGELVEHGFHEATTNPRRLNLWARVRPDALIGVAMPPKTVAVDVDDLGVFEAAGLDMPEAPTQRTPRGGYHALFKTDGRRVRQTVKEIPGADTRVGGKGYVIAWEPGAFPEVADLPDAPEWLYDDGSDASSEPEAAPLSIRRVKRTVEVATIRVGQRDNELARTAGHLRRAGLGPDAIYAAFKAMLENGQIESPREDPITDRDLRRIAGSIGTKQSATVERQRKDPPKRYFANDILSQVFPPLHYFVDELLPEGLGIIAGPPKVGKSWLVLQAAISMCTSGELLGRRSQEPTPVLYYALEDGQPRAQSRMNTLLGAQQLDLGWLEFRFEAPRIDEGLEEEIDAWLKDNGGGVVIIDVFARIRPPSKGRGSAYDEDYSILKPLHDIVKRNREDGRTCAVVVVTHTRKQGADDPFATVQGTMGITGSSDWTWIVKRERLKVEGNIFVSGRDIERGDTSVTADFAGGFWVAKGAQGQGRSPEQTLVLNALLTEGDSTSQEIADYLHPDEPGDPNHRYSANEKLVRLEEQGKVRKAGRRAGRGGAIVWHAITEDELQEVIEDVKAAASEALKRSNVPSFEVRRVSRGGARPGAHEKPPSHLPQLPHVLDEREEGEERETGGSPARGRTRTRRGRADVEGVEGVEPVEVSSQAMSALSDELPADTPRTSRSSKSGPRERDLR